MEENEIQNKATQQALKGAVAAKTNEEFLSKTNVTQYVIVKWTVLTVRYSKQSYNPHQSTLSYFCTGFTYKLFMIIQLTIIIPITITVLRYY